MRRDRFPGAAPSCLLNTAAACALIFVAAVSSPAQTRAGAPASPPPTQPPQSTGSTADEDFELKIDLRRISERDFSAETEVEADGGAGLRLRVGVALRASDIEVLLRNVQGRVRFRASLAPVLRLLEARRGAAQPQPQPPPPETSP